MEQIPTEIMTKSLDEWQLNLLTIFVITQIIGRAYQGLKVQGGLRGIINGIWFGANSPTNKDKQ